MTIIRYKPVNGLNDTSLNKLIAISGKDVIDKNYVDNAIANYMFNVLSSKDFGAIGDNSNDNYTYFNNMFKEAGKNIVYDTTINSNRFFTKTINIAPGIYRIKKSDLFADAFTVRTQNLVVHGNGAVFVFEGFEGNCFYNNDKILNVDFYNCNFISVSDDSAANRILFASNSSGGAQAIRFHNCNFGGKFKYGVNLTGSNCNSEWIWNACGFYGTWESFLYIGQTNTSDQFLNYWFNHCKYWCSSNWITAYKGGHFKFTKCDISGYAPTEETYLFNLLGINGSQGVQTFIDDGNRYELKSQYAKVLKCNWDMAHITFHESDMSSQAFNTNYVIGDVISIWNGTSGNGAIYKIQNSKILGKIKLTTNNNNLINKLIIENSILMQTNADTNADLENLFDNTNNQGTVNTFAIELYNTKFKNGVYNRTIKPLNNPKAVLNNKVHLNQSNYNKLLSTWSYEIIDPVIVKSISVFNWSQSIGTEYKFMIKTDLSVSIDSVSNGLITLTGSQTLLDIGDKFTIGNSDTVYTVSGQDYVGMKLRVTESLGAEAVSGAKISKVFNDITLTPNKSIIRDVYDSPVTVSNKIYLKCYGANTIDSNGLNVRVLVETLE